MMSTSTGRVTSKKKALPFTLALAVAAIASVAVMGPLAPSANAQAPAAKEDGGALWGKGGCANCHGNFAAGDGDAAYPQGPNLRQSKLTRDQLVETISCGRPGTAMPYNLAGAYTQTACYSLPLGPPPGEVTRGAGFSADQIQVLADFLAQNVLGKPNITRENCALFNNGNANAPACRNF